MLKVIEDLTKVHIGVLSLVLTGSLHDFIELSDNDLIHTLKDLDNICARLDIAVTALNKSGELRVNLLGPAGDLIVDNVYLFEFLLKERVVLLYVSESLVKLDDLLIHHAVA